MSFIDGRDALHKQVREHHPHLPHRVEVIDCTLRDGEQAPGVWFTLEEKLELAGLLDKAGVDLLDAGIAGTGEEAEMLKLELARAGCSRVCPPGYMPLPTMMWRHDGLPRLGELVRWCDEETQHPGIDDGGTRRVLRW